MEPRKLKILRSRSEICRRFRSMVLEKGGEDHVGWSCEKWSVTKSWRGDYRTNNTRRKANWIGHMLCRNCCLKRVIEGKIERRLEVLGRRGRRRKWLLDDLMEKRECWKLKEEALDRCLWTTGFGRGHGPVIRPTTEWKWKDSHSFGMVHSDSTAVVLL